MERSALAEDWPYLVERPGRGQVRACPLCGNVVIFNCWHEEEQRSVSSVVMNAAKAAWLRRNSGLYKRMQVACDGCGHTGPIEEGATIGGGYHCAECSGKTPRQVALARRKVS